MCVREISASLDIQFRHYKHGMRIRQFNCIRSIVGKNSQSQKQFSLTQQKQLLPFAYSWLKSDTTDLYIEWVCPQREGIAMKQHFGEDLLLAIPPLAMFWTQIGIQNVFSFF